MRHLDGLRIIAACAVVVLHYADYVKDHPAGGFMVSHTLHFNLFVDLFFVVSGFVIASQYLGKVGDLLSVGRFMWRRLARIYPLHLATLAFYLAIAAAAYFGLAKTDNPARYPLSDVPAQLLLLHAFDGQRLTFNFPSWSLSAEMFCYLLFPITALLAARRKALVIPLVVLPALANSVYVAATGSVSWAEWINQGGIFRALPGFNLGVACYVFRHQIARWPILPGALTTGLALFILLGWLLPEMAALIAVYAIAVLAIQHDVSETRTILSRLRFDRASAYAYSCYMLHIPIATIVLTVGARYLVSAPEGKLALLPVAAAMLAAASILSYRFFETPLRRTLNSAFDRKFTPSTVATVPAGSSQRGAR
ncbi:MAG: acyltransferase [Afipia sp.]|nr:acyltransferase [Afipia sp.]